MSNQLNYKLEITRSRLREWARWYNAVLVGHLTYRSRSLIAELHQGKGQIIKGTNHSHIISNPEAEEIDKLLNYFSKRSEKVGVLLKYHYINDAPLKEKIRHFNFSRQYYFRLVSQGEKWLNEQLHGKNE